VPDKPLERGRIPVILQAIRLIREKVGDFLPISSLVLSPFTLAAMLAGEAKFLTLVLKKPDYVRAFVDFATDFLIKYGKAQYRAGSDIVQMGDPTTSPDLIGPDQFRDFAMPSLIKLADKFKGIRLLHICGNAGKIIPDMAECGYDGISIEEVVDIVKAKPFVGDVKILSNISSKLTLLFGTTDQIMVEVKEAIEASEDIVEPGCGFAPGTPTAN
jgi:[methyl-Co(III) methanol-specific corrinoid protein]:coenzyme M methyltransferase